jgi:excisionase family DNA binding protein
MAEIGTGLAPGTLVRCYLKAVVFGAAAALRIGRNQAYEAVREKIIPALRIGERWVIPRAAFERLMRGETLESAT